MSRFQKLLLILHFLGLAMGFAVSFSNMVMSRLIAKAAVPEKAVLARFPPIMNRIGTVGLALLWVSGLILVHSRWGGFGTLPWQFHAKLAAVVLLTLAVGYIHMQQRGIRRGESAAAARAEAAGKVATLFALAALVFAVLTFE